MAVFSNFLNLGNSLRQATNNFSSFSTNVSNFSNNLNRATREILPGIDTAQGLINNNPVIRTVNNAKSILENVSNFFSNTKSNFNNIGTAGRMVQNALQGVEYGANPSVKKNTTAQVVDSTTSNKIGSNDWRVSISIPETISNISGPMDPLRNKTGGRMVFPFNPVILLSQSANYSPISPTHTNYQFFAYQNSQIDAITITGEFINENSEDAAYWLGCIHFLRTVTKMFYGNSAPLGNPPLICRLNGYGKHVLNNIPIVVTNFTIDLPAEVDYIPCVVDSEINYVPTTSQITVTCNVNYSRRSHSKFSLNEFAAGGFVNKPEGFI